MPELPKQIYLVDDAGEFLELTEQMLKNKGYSCQGFLSAKDCLETMKHKIPHLLVCDLQMPEVTGFEFISYLKKHRPTQKIPILISTGLADPKIIAQGAKMGANGFLIKPFSPNQLFQKIDPFFPLNLELDKVKHILRSTFLKDTSPMKNPTIKPHIRPDSDTYVFNDQTNQRKYVLIIHEGKSPTSLIKEGEVNWEEYLMVFEVWRNKYLQLFPCGDRLLQNDIRSILAMIKR